MFSVDQYPSEGVSFRRRPDHKPLPPKQLDSDEEYAKKNKSKDVKPVEKPTAQYTKSAFQNVSDDESESEDEDDERSQWRESVKNVFFNKSD